MTCLIPSVSHQDSTSSTCHDQPDVFGQWSAPDLVAQSASVEGVEESGERHCSVRIASVWLAEQCLAAGLDVRHDTVDSRGMRILHAVKL
ncbi:hypothetical protein [Streptomyces sp. NPDC001480]|uniref:hypothetical protein n=1 Tax=Streptomyces sp. NPDC001480 TaxID=3364577 RepID=UPI003691C08F